MSMVVGWVIKFWRLVTLFASPAERYTHRSRTWQTVFCHFHSRVLNAAVELGFFCAPLDLVTLHLHDSLLFFFKIRILVNMDDNIIEHYSNQSAFLIEISEPVVGRFQVTLAEV